MVAIKNEIPLGLKPITTEVNERQLTNRQFRRDIAWKNDSISYRLATQAMKE